MCTVYWYCANNLFSLLPIALSSSEKKKDYSDHSIEHLFQKRGLSTADIDQGCSNEHILEIYQNLEKWEQVSMHLGLKRADVIAIKQVLLIVQSL